MVAGRQLWTFGDCSELPTSGAHADACSTLASSQQLYLPRLDTSVVGVQDVSLGQAFVAAIIGV
jgi:hypothetical protein